MQLLPILISLALAAFALAFVLYPLRSLYHRPSVKVQPDAYQPAYTAQPHAVTTPLELEQSARAALQEVELDYQLGNITEADYRALQERYLRRALVALKTRHDQEKELDEAIEQQLRRMKGKV